jgi:hypothetical protein
MRDPATTYCFELKKSTPTSWRKVGYALRGKDERQRAAVAAMLVNGTIPPSPPSVAAAARICRTSRYLVRRALNGGQSNGNGNGKGKAISLAEHMLTSTPGELIAAAHALGVDQVWDLMIMPVMQATDRQSKAPK